MAALFSKPKISYPAPAQQATTEDEAAAAQAAKAEAERLRKRRGMRGTILTGAQGLSNTASVLKTSLG